MWQILAAKHTAVVLLRMCAEASIVKRVLLLQGALAKLLDN